MARVCVRIAISSERIAKASPNPCLPSYLITWSAHTHTLEPRNQIKRAIMFLQDDPAKSSTSVHEKHNFDLKVHPFLSLACLTFLIELRKAVTSYHNDSKHDIQLR